MSFDIDSDIFLVSEPISNDIYHPNKQKEIRKKEKFCFFLIRYS